MKNDFPKIVPIRGTIGFSYLVIENRHHAVLIDAVFGCGVAQIKVTLKKCELAPDCLKAIVLTHAHLDHCVHALAIQKWSGAPVICPRRDALYLTGDAHYSGLNKIGGALETLGRFLWRYRPPEKIIFLDDGDDAVPFAPSLHRISFPGHTPGHSGYFIPSKNALLAGDLFAGDGLFVHTPPRIFSADKKLALHSICQAASLRAKQVFVCHTIKADGDAGAVILEKLAKKISE